LFGIVPHGDPRTAAEALHELQLLAATADFTVSGCMVQHRREPDPHSYFGRGKVEELGEIVQRVGCGAVICDDSLSPNQGRAIEDVAKVPVIDRSELILQIFGMHAKTPQAKFQVELAALQYEMPRLKRRWTHLERQRGGIGVRGGAGEKQIDVDRSLLRTRIAKVTRELKLIEEHKQREIRARPDLFTCALVGYTNAGKSSLMNQLTEAGVLAENRLFSTLDTRTKPWRLPGGRTVLLSDTVGFVRKLPPQLVASFHATLEEALHADLLLVMVDGASPEAAEQLQTVDQVLESLGVAELPRITLINKLDAVEDRGMLASLWQHDPNAIAISVRTGEGLEQFTARVMSHLAQVESRVEILIPHHAGGLRSEIRACATVLSEDFTEDGCLMALQVSPAMLGRILAGGGRLQQPGAEGPATPGPGRPTDPAT
jgi:GTP-binding protein HflX